MRDILLDETKLTARTKKEPNHFVKIDDPFNNSSFEFNAAPFQSLKEGEVQKFLELSRIKGNG